LVGQTLGDEIEVIAVNDGSIDSTREILREYAEAYPEKIIVLTKENGGQASARNLALTVATGKYVGYVDADDYADLTMFEKMYAVAQDTDADLVVCDHYEVKDGQYTYKRFKDYEAPKGMFLDVLVSPWNKLVKRDLLLSSGVIFPEGYIYEDTAWFAELIPYVRHMNNVHEPLLYHIVQENSTMTAKQGERTAQIFSVLNSVIDFFREKNLYDEYYNELEFFYTRILLFSSLKRIAKIKERKLRNEFLKRTLREVKEKFPKYKKNPYVKGKKGAYIKSMNAFTIKIYAWLFGWRG
jgi:hypothetical protein